MGNVVRGVPLGADHYFFEALWTDWRVGPHPGILDWYTVLSAAVALVALTMHGALYLWLKNSGPLAERARRTALRMSPLLAIVTIASLVASLLIRPELAHNYQRHPAWFLVPAIVAASLVIVPGAISRHRARGAFLGSCAYLIAMLAGAAIALYPNVLPASTDPRNSLTIENAASGAHVLQVGLYWWLPGIAIAIGYFVFIYRMFRGKVTLQQGHGY